MDSLSERYLVVNTASITVTGNLTRDPEFSEPKGHPKLSFSVAASHRYQQQGEWVEKPSFFNVVAWRQTAEQANSLLEKGMKVTVTGRLDQRSWTTDDGDKRSTVEIVADSIAIDVWALESVVRRKAGGGGGSSPSKAKSNSPSEDPW